MTFKTKIMTRNLAGQSKRNGQRTLFVGCLMFGLSTFVLGQGQPQAKTQRDRGGEDSPRLTQVVALDECDPATFNAALGADFCKNVTLGYFTTLDNLFAGAAAGTPDPNWDFEPDQVTIKRGDTLSEFFKPATSTSPICRKASITFNAASIRGCELRSK